MLDGRRLTNLARPHLVRCKRESKAPKLSLGRERWDSFAPAIPKAPEHWRTPRRCRDGCRVEDARVLECGGAPPLSPLANESLGSERRWRGGSLEKDVLEGGLERAAVRFADGKTRADLALIGTENFHGASLPNK